jgi:hypothetical protein
MSAQTVPQVSHETDADIALVAAHASRIGLTVKQQRFVERYVLTGNGAGAVREAGYSPAAANTTAQRLLRGKRVAAAVAAIRADLAKRADYTLAKFIVELDEKIAKAEATNPPQMSAVAKLLEIKGKATGVYVERLDARVAVGGFMINVYGLVAPEVANA